LTSHGYQIIYLDAGHDSLALNGQDPHVVITLGGPVSAYDLADYPWLLDEMRLLSACLRDGRPVLAICLGAQILAQALRPRAFKCHPEIGWAPITLTEAGKQSVLCAMEEIPVLHWHGDAFELPVGARRLASSAECQNQAYSIGSALAVQFHPEVSSRNFER